MITKTLFLMAALAGPVFLNAGTARAADEKEDLQAVYEAGRAAFNKGDLVKAKAAFTKVMRANPDFELGKIYMAQIRHAEAQLAARPRTQKVAEKAVVRLAQMDDITLADALEVVRRELERADSGPGAAPVALVMDLPPARLELPVTFTAKDLPMKTFIDAVAYAGGVGIAWHQKGLSVTGSPVPPSGTDKEILGAIRKMKQTASAKIIPSLHFEGVSLDDALTWLRARADAAGGGPLIVEREPLSDASITLQLRNVSLTDALRAVAMQANVDLDWRPWGVGIRAKSTEPETAPDSEKS